MTFLVHFVHSLRTFIISFISHPLFSCSILQTFFIFFINLNSPWLFNIFRPNSFKQTCDFWLFLVMQSWTFFLMDPLSHTPSFNNYLSYRYLMFNLHKASHIPLSFSYMTFPWLFVFHKLFFFHA